MVMVFLIIISMCFVLVKMLPNKPAEQFGKDMALIEMRREALGYNKPMIEQYGIFVRKTLLGGDWGISESLYLGQNVWDKFMEKMPATVIVNAYTMIFGVPLGLLFGIYAALKTQQVTRAYNLSTLTETSLKELVSVLEQAVGHEIPVSCKEARSGDIYQSVLANGRARRALGWQPEVSLEEGLRRTYRYFQEMQQ